MTDPVPSPGERHADALGPEGSLKRAALRGILWTAAQRWGAEAISTLTFVVLARMLLPQAFGLIAIAKVFTSLAQLLVESGLESAIVQRRELRKTHLDTAFWLNVTVGAALTCFGLFGADAAAAGIAWLGSSVLPSGAGASEAQAVVPLLQALSVSFLLSSVCTVPTALYRRALRFEVLAVRNWCGTLVGGAVGVGFALNGAGVWSLVWMQLAESAAGIPILWIRAPFRPGFAVAASSLRELLGFGAHIFAMRLVDFVATQADRLVVGSALGASQLGFLTLGQRIPLSLNRVLAQTIGGVVLPTFARVHGDPSRFLRGYLTALHVLALVTVPGFLGVAATAPDLVLALFGPTWEDSVPVVQVLSVVGLFQTFSLVNGPVIMSTGRTGALLALATVAAAAKLVALFFASRWGIVAVSAVAAIEAVIQIPVQFAILRAIAGISARHLAGATAPAFLSGAVAVAAAVGARHLAADHSTVLRLAAQFAAGAAAYVATLLVVDRRGLSEVKELAASLRDRSRGAPDRPPEGDPPA